VLFPVNDIRASCFYVVGCDENMLDNILNLLNAGDAAAIAVAENLDDLHGKQFGLELVELAGGFTGFHDGIPNLCRIKRDTPSITFTNFRKRYGEFNIHSNLNGIYVLCSLIPETRENERADTSRCVSPRGARTA